MSSKKIAESKTIKKRLKQLKLSESHLAQHIMRPASEISAYLKGEVDLPYSIVWKMCDFLELL